MIRRTSQRTSWLSDSTEQVRLLFTLVVFSMMFLAFAIDFPKKLAQESTAMPAPVPQEERMTRY